MGGCLTSGLRARNVGAPIEHREGMELGATELWDRILGQARRGLPEQTFRTWLASAEAVSWSGGILHVTAPSRFHAEWLEDKYGETVHEIARAILGAPVELRVSTEPGDAERSTPEISVAQVEEPDASPPYGEPRAAADMSPAPARPVPGLNVRYTFDRFIVGENNRLAQAASMAVAERPARSYNPLFLYGGTGLGKTHLMQAIANRLREAGGTRICYIPAEQFVNEMVSAIGSHTTDAFRGRYRSFDLLLVDDVQFLRGKERTQEEFFHTFNVLYNSGRQIVLTSDRHPRELKGLEDRLVSRFEWGLVAGVDCPEYETRVAILQRKAEEDDLSIGPTVVDLIARCCRSSVRELEGALIKLLAVASLTGREPTLDLARIALAGMAELQERSPLDAESIRDRVADVWGVTGKALASKSRTRKLVVPRQVAMFLTRELLDLPLARIGGAFGDRDHTTVIHSIRKVEARLRTDGTFQAKVDELRETLAKSA